METFIQHPAFICLIVSLIVSLLSTFGWSVFDIERKRMLFISIGFTILSGILFYPDYYYFFVASFGTNDGGRLLLLSPLMLLITSIFVAGDIKGKQIISVISYALNLLFLLMGLEGLKSSGNTWGNYCLLVGIYVVFNMLLILQLQAYICESNFVYGLLKLLFGVASVAIIIIWGLNTGDDYYSGDIELLSRKITVLVSAAMIIEGVLLIYKWRRSRQPKIGQYEIIN